MPPEALGAAHAEYWCAADEVVKVAHEVVISTLIEDHADR
jgi:hypothetical protein